jgi:hypothetical protein
MELETSVGLSSSLILATRRKVMNNLPLKTTVLISISLHLLLKIILNSSSLFITVTLIKDGNSPEFLRQFIQFNQCLIVAIILG